MRILIKKTSPKIEIETDMNGNGFKVTLRTQFSISIWHGHWYYQLIEQMRKMRIERNIFYIVNKE